MSTFARITKATANPSYSGSVIVTVQCPFCERQHTHGVPGPITPAKEYGYRIAHCSTGEGGQYRLTDRHGLVAEAVAL